MAIIMEICLEELDTPENNEPFIRCVALPGGEEGLSLDRHGQIRWMPEPGEATQSHYGLWTSADDKLVLFRAKEAADPIIVERGGRTLQAPAEKPVILLDGDTLRVNGRSYRVHFHGETDAIYPPERLSRSTISKLVGGAVAATMALGTMVSSSTSAETTNSQRSNLIEVRTHPPAPMPPKRVEVFCTIKKQKATSKGLKITARCSSKNLRVGQWGEVVKKKKNERVPKGQVQVTKVEGKDIEATAKQLSKPVKNVRLRFWVNAR